MDKRKYTTRVEPLQNPPNAVREFRSRLGMSCADIARLIGSDQAAVSRFELKGIGMSRGKIQRMAEEVFNLKPWQQIYDPTSPQRVVNFFSEESVNLS